MKGRLLCAVALIGLGSTAARAQTAPAATPPSDRQASDDNGGGLREIIVTAQRKSERLQEVPISVNVVSGEQLAARGAGSSVDLVSLVPGLQFTTSGGAGTPFLRGIGTTNGDPNVEASVATYVDGVYIANNYTNIQKLENIERIEVLKGPQGTLFGRNATGGVIQVVTKDPTSTPMMDMAVGYSNYETVSGSLYATTGIAENLDGNLSIQGSNQGHGWGHNIYTGAQTFRSSDFSARVKLLWKPTDDIVVHLSGDYGYMKSGTSDFRLPPGVAGIDGVPAPQNPYDTTGTVSINQYGEPFLEVNQFGGSLRIDYSTDIGQFVNITAYRKSFGTVVFDPDMTPVPLTEVSFRPYQHNISEELQYISPKSWPISLTAGVFYFNNSAGYNYGSTVAGTAVSSIPNQYASLPYYGMQKDESIAGYAQADATIVHNTKLTLGIRFTHETDKATIMLAGQFIPVPNSIGYDKPTWRVALDHAFTSNIHAYVSYNRGVKAGGFDLEDFSGLGHGFNPEKLDAYEVGLKTQLFNNRVRFNTAYFFYNYSNIQLQVIPSGGAVALSQTINAAKAHIQGVDLDFAVVPVRNLTFNGGFAYIHGEYLRFDEAVPSYPVSVLNGTLAPTYPNGNPTVRTPTYSANLGVTYNIETDIGKLNFTGSSSYNGSYSFSPDNRFRQASYVLLNLSAGWTAPKGGYGITAFVSNLTDARYLEANVPSALGPLTNYGAPRTFGVSLRVKIGG